MYEYGYGYADMVYANHGTLEVYTDPQECGIRRRPKEKRELSYVTKYGTFINYREDSFG